MLRAGVFTPILCPLRTKSAENKVRREQSPSRTTSAENKVRREQSPPRTKSAENEVHREQSPPRICYNGTAKNKERKKVVEYSAENLSNGQICTLALNVGVYMMKWEFGNRQPSNLQN
jgi:hypothetical protein